MTKKHLINTFAAVINFCFSFPRGMKGACVLLFSLLGTTAGAQMPDPTLVAYREGTPTTYDNAVISTWDAEVFTVDLSDADSIVASGTWSGGQMGGLRCALRNSNKPFPQNRVLKAADLSAVILGVGGWEGDDGGFSHLFFDCAVLKTVKIPDGTDYVWGGVSFNATFSNCPLLISPIDLSSFATVTSFNETFRLCGALTTVILPERTTYSQPISFQSTFSTCNSLTSPIDLSNFHNVSSFEMTFLDCHRLETITLPTAVNNAIPVSFKDAFRSCYVLTSPIDLSLFTHVSSFEATFMNCFKLEEITMPASTSYDQGYVSFHWTFSDCKVLKGAIDVSGFPNISELERAFGDCYLLKNVTLPAATTYPDSLRLDQAFIYCYNLASPIDLSGFTKVKGLGSTFAYCHQIPSVRLGGMPPFNPKISQTFENANPNMLKYLPKDTDLGSITTWSSYTNFINGSTAADNPTAYNDIVLVDNIFVKDYLFPTDVFIDGTIIAPFFCPLEFELPAGKTISYTRDFTGRLSSNDAIGWQSIVLPFDAVIEGKTADECGEGNYQIARYADADAAGHLSFRHADAIAAYVPHIVWLPQSEFGGSAKLRFVSEPGATVAETPAAPAGLSDTKGDFSYTGTLLGTSGEAYYLENQTTVDQFVKKELDGYWEHAADTEAQPFRAHFKAVAPSALDALSISIVGPGDPGCPATWIGAGRGVNPPVTTEAEKNLWSIPSNWRGTFVPVDNASVDYHAAAIDLHADGTYRVANITNPTTAGLTVLPGAALTITDWTNTIGIDGKILVRAEAAADDKANAAFLVPTGSVVNATVEFQSLAINTIETENITTQEMKWQYFGIPITECAAQTFYGAWVRRFMHTETIAEGSEITNTYWEWLENSDIMKPMQGYEISVPKDHSGGFALTGRLNTADRSFPVEYEGGDRYTGQWVLSNPFTAGVNVDEIIFESGRFDESIWLFNTGSSTEWKVAEPPAADAAAPGQYTVMPAQTGGVIPSMQGFVVKLAGQADGIITLPYPAAAAAMPMLRSQQRQRKPHEKIYTDIALLSGDGMLKDRMQLYTDPRTTRGYDNGWDGRKMFGAARLAALYSSEADGNRYQVNALPCVDNTYLSVKAETGTRDYALRFVHHNTADTYDELWLSDLELGIDINITADSSVYRFTADNETTPTRRFRIATVCPDGEETAAGIEVYRNSTDILVRNHYAATVALHIYTASGHLYMSRSVPPLSDIRLSESLFPQGVYLVEGRAQSGEKSVVKMVTGN